MPTDAVHIDIEAFLQPGNDVDRFLHIDAFETDAYVVDVIPGGIESANCHATAMPNRDTHILLGDTPNAPKNRHVIVEVTPRVRAAVKAATGADWSTPALRALVGHRIRVKGWALWDAEHVGAAENTHPGGRANWRATVYEIHPVTSITVLDP